MKLKKSVGLKSIFKNEYKAKTTKLFPMKKMKYAWKNDKKDEQLTMLIMEHKNIRGADYYS